jgi:S1-C subfamily serine protease
MRRVLFLLIALVGLGTGAVLLIPLESAGCMSSTSVPTRCFGSGVYIGRELVLTNQHLAEIAEQSSFKVPAWKFLVRSLDSRVREIKLLDQELNLGLIEIEPSLLSWVRVVTPCWATRPVRRGDSLSVVSSVGGRFPLSRANLVVTEERPALRPDPSPLPNQPPTSSMTIVARLSRDQTDLVGPGSSGSPVVDARGRLVGLVWTGRAVGDGSTEVWITPATSWIPRLRKADIPQETLQALLDAQCSD